MNFEFIPINKNIEDDELIVDIQSVAKQLKKNQLTIKEYDENGKYNSSTIIRRFRTWNIALEKAELIISNQLNISREELYQNILNIWEHLGRQPRRADLGLPISKYSQSPYNREFKTWNNALQLFVDWANQEEFEISYSPTFASSTIKKTTGRDASLRLRFKVMKRDNFCCVQCGSSPAKDPSVELHIDHIHPWSHGRLTILENLQTLCLKCNLGKGNIE